MRSHLFALCLLPFAAGCFAEPAPSARCGQPGQWLVPDQAQAQAVQPAALLARLAQQQVVLLGEIHDSAEDHRWQVHTLAQLHAQQSKLAIGFEMFPRRVQPVLDQWVAGTLSETEFLRRVEWEKIWGYDAREYLPLFHFARMNRIPMLALNIEHSLSEAVGRNGWDKVPDADKEGVGRPAAPSKAYLELLKKVFEHHPEKKEGKADFAHFVEAQILWDRAMAEAIASHLGKEPDALVVGIIGAAHVRNGHGVAHQLKELGITRVGSMLTWDQRDSCARIERNLADVLYVVAEPKADAPRLGVATESVPGGQGGVRIADVTAGSVAETAGLKKGDVILEAAGQPIKGFQKLRTTVQRQAPGTWLPLKVRRDGSELEIIARFPPAS